VEPKRFHFYKSTPHIPAPSQTKPVHILVTFLQKPILVLCSHPCPHPGNLLPLGLPFKNPKCMCLLPLYVPHALPISFSDLITQMIILKLKTKHKILLNFYRASSYECKQQSPPNALLQCISWRLLFTRHKFVLFSVATPCCRVGGYRVFRSNIICLFQGKCREVSEMAGYRKVMEGKRRQKVVPADRIGLSERPTELGSS
jgi:hypothetical protein